MPMTASAATETAAIRHPFRDAGGGWVRSRFPTVARLADGRRTRQPRAECWRFKWLDSGAT